MIAELVIRGGTVVDGTGAPAFDADVAIAGGRIAAIGASTDIAASVAPSTDVLDADGLLVVPGFVDVHTHYDAQLTWDPWLTPSSQLGVTSAVLGNCGFSLAPCRPELRGLMMRTLEAVEDIPYASMEEAIAWDFETYPEFLRSVSRRGLGLNVGGYIGHTAVRLYVMGEEAYEREATAREVDAMCAVVRDAVVGGALGFSTDRAGFLQGDKNRPVPSVVATHEETIALCHAVAETGRGIVHIAPGDTYAWVYELAERFPQTITWSAILAYPPSKPVNWQHKLGLHAERVAAGAAGNVHPQVTSRVLTFQFGMANPIVLYGCAPFGELARMPHDEARAAALRDPVWRERARAESSALQIGWDAMVVDETRDAAARGRSLRSVAESRAVHPVDALADIALADGMATRLHVAAANTDPSAVGSLLTGPQCILGLTDAGAHVGQLCDAAMPLHFLATYVRERELMSMEAGVRKTGAEIAEVVGLQDRGALRIGAYADIAVLDWDRLDPGPVERAQDLPGGAGRLVANRPIGVEHVLVNGVVTRRAGVPVASAAQAGMLLAPKRYSA